MLLFIHTIISLILLTIFSNADFGVVDDVMEEYSNKMPKFIFVVLCIFFFQEFFLVLYIIHKKKERDENKKEKQDLEQARDYILANWKQGDRLTYRLIYYCPHPEGYVVFSTQEEKYVILSLPQLIEIGNKDEKQRQVQQQQEKLKQYIEAHNII